MPAPLSRRAALAAPVALAAATAGAAPTHPDAALIAACEELNAAARGLSAAEAAPDWDNDALDAASCRWYGAMEAAAKAPATTPAGLRAKAQAVLLAFRQEALVLPGGTFEDTLEPHERLAYRLAEDIALRM